MLKNGQNYNDIYNYRNSKYFINSVIEVRKAESPNKDTVIFAGACQSFFEAIMSARSELCIISCKNTYRFYRSFSCSRKNCNNR
ncbi:MAG: hypothetical protein K2H53_01050 [Clostridia bacterium]|nr:hypothetical protein [Clostridia bacterium]